MCKRIVSMVTLLGSLATTNFAGELSPPAGPIAPTGRFGPRIEISQATTPGDADSVFRIVTPGSYYLSGNVVGLTGKTGIEITSSEVTIDLMGFKLRGFPGSLNGIGAALPVSSVTIRNGVISDWGGDGISLQFFGNGAVIEGILADGNTGAGIVGVRYAIISSCTVINNGVLGILTFDGSVVSSSVARFNGLDGISTTQDSVIQDCAASFNTGAGIALTELATVRGFTVRFSSGDGITGQRRNLIQANHLIGLSSTGSGIRLTEVGNRVDSNFASSSLRGFLATSNNNLFTRNSSTGNMFNYDLSSGNFARVVAATSSGGIVGDAGGVAVAPEDPWINIV